MLPLQVLLPYLLVAVTAAPLTDNELQTRLVAITKVTRMMVIIVAMEQVIMSCQVVFVQPAKLDKHVLTLLTCCLQAKPELLSAALASADPQLLRDALTHADPQLLEVAISISGFLHKAASQLSNTHHTLHIETCFRSP